MKREKKVAEWRAEELFFVFLFKQRPQGAIGVHSLFIWASRNKHDDIDMVGEEMMVAIVIAVEKWYQQSGSHTVNTSTSNIMALSLTGVWDMPGFSEHILGYSPIISTSFLQ